MIRQVLTDEAFLTGQDHVTVAELGVHEGIDSRGGGLHPAQPGGSLKELARYGTQDHLGLRGVLERLGRCGHNDLGIAPRSGADTRHILGGEVSAVSSLE